MRKCGFLLTYSLLYKDRIYDFVLIRENVGQGKPVFSHILCSGSEKQMSEITKNGWRKIFLIAEIIEQNSNKPFLKTLKRKLDRGNLPLLHFMLFMLCKIHFKIALLRFFEQSRIVSIYTADSTRVVWTWSLSAAKNCFGTACIFKVYLFIYLQSIKRIVHRLIYIE